MSFIKTVALFVTTTVFLIVSTTIFAASDFTAKQLRNDCEDLLYRLDNKDKNKTDDSSVASGFCMGYLDGFEDMHINTAYLLSGGSDDIKEIEKYFIYCIPRDITNIQLVQTIIDHVNKNPKDANIPAGTVLLMMLIEKYPCKKNPETTPAPEQQRQADNK